MGTQGIIERYVNFYTDFSKFDKIERSEYEESLKNLRDWYSLKKTHIEEGIKKGREEGREEERVRMALQMKEKGYSLDAISELTKISIEELEKL